MTAPLRFRGATPDDVPRLAANSLRAYPVAGHGLAARIKRYLDGPYPLETVFLTEDDGIVVGQARTLDYRCWLGGVEVAVGGLAGVAVAPEARRRGIAAAIVAHHLAQCRERGAAWSLLYPFAPRFYSAHGWGPSSRRLRWRLRPRVLPRGDGVVRRAPSLDAIRACYERHCVLTSGSLSRSERLMSFELDAANDSRHVVGVHVDGAGSALRGYLVYEAIAPTLRPQIMLVREWVALDAGAERTLFGFIAAQGDQFDAVLLDTPVEHPLAALDHGEPEREDELMPPEHHPIATLYSGLMARVVDLDAALRGRGYPGRSGAVAVAITEDALLPDNRRTVTLRVDDGVATTGAGRAAGVPLVAGPVGAISSLLSGGVGLAAAARAGFVTVDGDVAAGDALLALPVPYPLVYF